MSDLSNEPIHLGACNCGMCSGGQSNGWTGENNGEDPGMIETGAPSGVATKEQFGLYLTDGYWQDAYSQYGAPYSTANFQGWTDTTLTFSIANWYSAAEKNGIRDAFQQWSDVTNLSFTEVASGGQIYFEAPGGGETGRAFAQTGWSFSGGNATIVNPVRVVIDYDSGGFGSDPTDLGNYALMTAIHEIGHAIGLGHSGYYNAGQGNPTYANDAQWTNETRQYSLMSYWDASNSGASHQGEYAATPMLMDIYAIQSLYGAKSSTRSGNTVYGFNSTAGDNQFDFTVNVRPVIAIWDGGGTDTLDLSGYSMAQTIRLTAGEFSNVGGSTGNVVIAYNAVVENAIGGSGNDSIYGNTANNILRGGLGNDTFYGSAGNDTLNGEGGTDTANYSFDISAFLISLVDSVTVTLQHIAQAWTDTVTNIENFLFSGAAYTFAQVQALVAVPETYTTFFREGSTKYYYQSTAFGTDAVTATELGYGGTTGTIATFVRSASAMVITINSTSAPSGFNFAGTSADENVLINGTHSNFSVVYTGGDGNDTFSISSVTGADTLYGGNGNDTLSAGNGDDKLYGEVGNDILNGDSGNDILVGGSGDDTLHGGSGDDSLYGDDGNDTLNGNDGIDRIWGGLGLDIINGGNGNDTIYGGDGNDTIDGGANDDYLIGEAGDDIINGGDGFDTVIGGLGNDTLNGGLGNDTINGNDGVDTINAGDGNDLVTGDNGNDVIHGDNGADKIYGYANDDQLYGDAGVDIIYGGDGNDTINGGTEADDLFGENGNDNVSGGAGNDRIWGEAGDDTINGDDGNDIAYGGDGNDILYGGNGDDFLYGDAGNNTINGDAGVDRLYGGNNIDTINGGTENDVIYGFDSNDILNGDAGDDFLYGGNGLDVLNGGAGNDRIYGDAGNDTITFGAGIDNITGGAGADTFVVAEEPDFDHDMSFILDFAQGSGDRLDLSNLLSDYTAGVDDLSDYVQVLQGANTTVQVDRDGAGSTYGWDSVVRLQANTTISTDVDQLVTNGTLVV